MLSNETWVFEVAQGYHFLMPILSTAALENATAVTGIAMDYIRIICLHYSHGLQVEKNFTGFHSLSSPSQSLSRPVLLRWL